MTWFVRDHTGRPLAARECQFLAALTNVLDEIRPCQLLPSETALTAEGADCLILLMPHRALGGVSIVVWLYADKAAVTWAQVAGLGCCHDSLDLCLRVAEFPLDAAVARFGPVLECIREQFARAITLQVFGTRGTVLVGGTNGKLQTVGAIGPYGPWLRRLWRGRPDQEVELRFTDEAVPPVAEPSGVAEWFTSGH